MEREVRVPVFESDKPQEIQLIKSKLEAGDIKRKPACPVEQPLAQLARGRARRIHHRNLMLVVKFIEIHRASPAGKREHLVSQPRTPTFG